MRSTTPDDGRGWLRGIPAALALAVLAGPSGVSASSFTADLVGHYGNLDSYVMELQPDSTLKRVRRSTSFWSQEYRAGYSTLLPMRAGLVTELRYLDVSTVGVMDRSTTPYGMLRLTAPILGVSASYQPSKRTFEGSASGDTAGSDLRRLTSKFADFQFGAYLAPSRLPRVDVQYNRQHHFAGAEIPEGTSTLRTVRAAQDFGNLAVHAGYSDQANRRDGTGQYESRSWNAGFDLRAPASKRRTGNLSYGYLRGERPRPGGWTGTDNHNLNAYGTYRFSTRSWLNGGGYYRLAQIRSPQRLDVTDYDVYAYHNYATGRGVTTRVGGGEHTFQELGRTRAAPYLTALISADGSPRPGWRGRANFTHSTNWIENRGPSSIESFGLGSTFSVSRTFEARVDAGAGVRSGAIILGSQRYTSVASAGVRMLPLRSLTLGLDGSAQAVGGDLFQPSSQARSGSATLSWQPSQGTTFSASRTVSGAFPHNRPRTYGTALAGSLRLGRSAQLDGNYSNSSTTATTAAAAPGLETFGFRLAVSLTRRLSTSVGFQDSGHGQPGESRALDVTATYRFQL